MKDNANTIFSADEQNSFLLNIIISFNDNLSAAQKERLASMAKSEKTKSFVKNGFTIK